MAHSKRKLLLVSILSSLIVLSTSCEKKDVSKLEKIAATDKLIAEQAALNQTCDVWLRDENGFDVEILKTIYKHEAKEASDAIIKELGEGANLIEIRC